MPDLILENPGSMAAAGFTALPAGWVGVIGIPRWKKPYGWHDHVWKIIEVHAPAWIPRFMRKPFERITWEHEARHAWGNPGCKRAWCLGFEHRRWVEYLAMPVQLVAGLRFCGKCRAFGK